MIKYYRWDGPKYCTNVYAKTKDGYWVEDLTIDLKINPCYIERHDNPYTQWVETTEEEYLTYRKACELRQERNRQ